VPLKQQRQLWHEDRLGLRHLHDHGRLHFDEVPGSHMQFSLQELYEVLDKYMSSTSRQPQAANSTGDDIVDAAMSSDLTSNGSHSAGSSSIEELVF
jgi:hypothetical protein